MELDEKLCDHLNIVLGKVRHIDSPLGKEGSEVEIVIDSFNDLRNCVALIVAVHLQTVELLLKYPVLIEVLMIPSFDSLTITKSSPR